LELPRCGGRAKAAGAFTVFMDHGRWPNRVDPGLVSGQGKEEFQTQGWPLMARDKKDKDERKMTGRHCILITASSLEID
jgi:hypothetical protein